METAKFIGRAVGELAASGVASNIIARMAPANLSKLGKVGWIVGGACIAGAVAAKAGDYAEDLVESIGEMVDTIKEMKNGKVTE